MLEKVKMALRVDGNDLDVEIQDMIEGCLLDLKISGVITYDPEDKLILRAVITYCRAYFDTNNQDFEKYCASYDSLKTHLALCSEYAVVV